MLVIECNRSIDYPNYVTQKAQLKQILRHTYENILNGGCSATFTDPNLKKKVDIQLTAMTLTSKAETSLNIQSINYVHI